MSQRADEKILEYRIFHRITTVTWAQTIFRTWSIARIFLFRYAKVFCTLLSCCRKIHCKPSRRGSVSILNAFARRRHTRENRQNPIKSSPLLYICFCLVLHFRYYYPVLRFLSIVSELEFPIFFITVLDYDATILSGTFHIFRDGTF